MKGGGVPLWYTDRKRAVVLFLLWIGAVAVILFTCTVLSVFAESVLVRIPVACTGDACTVVLCDMESGELRRLPLKAGEPAFLEAACDGLRDFHYLVKLADGDSRQQMYDRTEYHVTVTTCRGENGELQYAITADQLGPLGTEDSGKAEALLFDNSAPPSAGEKGEPFSENPPSDTKAGSGAKVSESMTSLPGKQSASGATPKASIGKKIEGTLPQTGSLWLWMAPWLAVAGTGMIMAGLRMRRKQR